jgi:hypothetical protein
MATADRMCAKRYTMFFGLNHLAIAGKDSNMLIAFLGVGSPENQITRLCTCKGDLLSAAIIVLVTSIMGERDLLDLVDGVFSETTAVESHDVSVVFTAWRAADTIGGSIVVTASPRILSKIVY